MGKKTFGLMGLVFVLFLLSSCAPKDPVLTTERQVRPLSTSAIDGLDYANFSLAYTSLIPRLMALAENPQVLQDSSGCPILRVLEDKAESRKIELHFSKNGDPCETAVFDGEKMRGLFKGVERIDIRYEAASSETQIEKTCEETQQKLSARSKAVAVEVCAFQNRKVLSLRYWTSVPISSILRTRAKDGLERTIHVDAEERSLDLDLVTSEAGSNTFRSHFRSQAEGTHIQKDQGYQRTGVFEQRVNYSGLWSEGALALDELNFLKKEKVEHRELSRSSWAYKNSFENLYILNLTGAPTGSGNLKNLSGIITFDPQCLIAEGELRVLSYSNSEPRAPKLSTRDPLLLSASQVSNGKVAKVGPRMDCTQKAASPYGNFIPYDLVFAR